MDRVSSRHRAHPLSVLRHVVLVILAVFSLAPLTIAVFSSLKTQAEVSRSPLSLPENPQWQNYVDAWVIGGFGTGLVNSTVLVAGAVVLVCIIASAAAYSLTRLDLPGGATVILYLLVVNSLPIQLFLVPLFFSWTTLGLYDTHLGLIIIYAAVNAPFATLLLRSFMLSIPRDYEDAARIDGAGELRVFFSVTLPLVSGGVMTIALTTALAVYNEFLLALLFIQSPEFMPIATGLFNFRNGFTQNYPLQAAAGLTMLAPMLFVFILLQRRFVSGIASTGLGGN